MPSQRRAFLGGLCSVGTGLVAGCVTTSGRTDRPPTETPTESSSDLASIGGPTTWSPQAKLAASTGTDGDEFGTTVSMSGDRSTAVVGAPGADSRFSPAAGSAYVFDRAGGKWSQSATLLASGGPEGTAFGRAVAVDDHGDRILVGAPGEDGGTAYLFEAGPDGWTQTARLPVGTDGRTVALSGDGSTALVETSRTGTAARVFAVDGDGFSRVGSLVGTTDARPSDLTLARDGTAAVVGETAADDADGVATVYRTVGEEWVVDDRVRAADAALSSFGRSVAVDGDGTTLLVGADTGDGGIVSVYDRTDGSWSRTATLSGRAQGPDRFGDDVALSADGSRAAVGASVEAARAGETSGTAYVFGVGPEGWRTRARLVPPDSQTAGDEFGYAVSIAGDGETVLVGARGDTRPNGPRSGSAYVFTTQ